MRKVTVDRFRPAPANFRGVALVTFSYSFGEFDPPLRLTRRYQKKDANGRPIEGKDGWADAPIADVSCRVTAGIAVRVHDAVVQTGPGGRLFLSVDGVNVPPDIKAAVMAAVSPQLSQLGQITRPDDWNPDAHNNGTADTGPADPGEVATANEESHPF